MKQRQILVDLTMLNGKAGGIALYGITLAKYLESELGAKVFAPEFIGNEFRNPVVCPPPVKFRGTVFFRHPESVRKVLAGATGDAVIYSPFPRAFPGSALQIITIHDLMPYAYRSMNPVEVFYYSFILPRKIRQIPAIFTVSEVSKQAISDHFQLDPTKIFVIPNSLDSELWCPGREKADEPPFLLIVGANQPWKNTIEFLNLHRLWKRNFRLKIVSTASRYGRRVRKRVEELGLQSVVDFPEDVSQERLIQFYRQAVCLVAPATMEGAGRPPLEAMSVGCPVILSDIPAHKEFFDKAGIFIHPGDVESYEKAIESLSNKEIVEKCTQQGYLIAGLLSNTSVLPAAGKNLSSVVQMLN